MNPLVSGVGRLQRLAVFESAARCGSFTAAARELGITQPAVTRHIRALERSVGRELFDRGPNRVVLNPIGLDLLGAVQSGFSVISAGVAHARHTGSRIVLAANPGIAQRWLVPHLDHMKLAVENADVHLWLFDRETEMVRGSFDLAIHLGCGPWPGLRAEQLFREVTVPVASPAYAVRAGLDGDSTAHDLLRANLLHLDTRDRSWMTWTDWFAGHGLDDALEPTVTYSNHALVVQDALAGRGVALGWRYLVDDLVAQGILVEVGQEVATSDSYDSLLWPETTSTEIIERFKTWFVELLVGETP